MPWMRHILRESQVWAEVDLRGHLLTDEGGRVQVVYKRGPGAKIYKAGARNLGAVAGAAIEPDMIESPTDAPRVAPGPGDGPPRTPTPPSTRKLAGASKLGPKTLTLADRLPADAIHIWTDGACTGNPGPAGIGVVVIDGKVRREHKEYLGHGTNNIAELTGVLRGLDMIDRTDHPVLVYTDSSYAIGVLSLGWKAKANTELVAEIRDRLGAFDNVRFVKVSGHAGVPENERCDELARTAITSRR